jgi:hypothetical protein
VQLATDAQIKAGSSTTSVATASQANAIRFTGNTSEVDLTPFTWLSTFSIWTGTRNRLNFPINGTTAAGSGIWNIENQCANLNAVALNGIDWTKRVTLSGRFYLSQTTPSTNNIFRFTLGKLTGAVGDLSGRGIGVRCLYGSAIELQVHDGTTLANVTSSFTPTIATIGTIFDVQVVSDGAGNATLFVNGNSVATSTGAPTTASTSGRYYSVYELVSATTNTTSPAAVMGLCKVDYGR